LKTEIAGFFPILQTMIVLKKSSQIITFLLVLIVSSCASIKDPELVSIENVRLQRFGLKESAVKVDLHYHNPNKFRIKLKKAEGEAWADGNKLGQFNIDTLIHIPASGDFILPIVLNMDMKNFLGNMALLISNKPIMLKVDGKARVGKSLIYVDYPLKFEDKVNLNQLMNSN
jgi:LEA14-like dessication related protein